MFLRLPLNQTGERNSRSRADKTNGKSARHKTLPCSSAMASWSLTADPICGLQVLMSRSSTDSTGPGTDSMRLFPYRHAAPGRADQGRDALDRYSRVNAIVPLKQS